MDRPIRNGLIFSVLLLSLINTWILVVDPGCLKAFIMLEVIMFAVGFIFFIAFPLTIMWLMGRIYEPLEAKWLMSKKEDIKALMKSE